MMLVKKVKSRTERARGPQTAGIPVLRPRWVELAYFNKGSKPKLGLYPYTPLTAAGILDEY